MQKITIILHAFSQSSYSQHFSFVSVWLYILKITKLTSDVWLCNAMKVDPHLIYITATANT
jgi:hypothetical protein